MKTINIIGAGRLGQTLAHLWHKQTVFRIGAVCTRSLVSAGEAVDFIQAGLACAYQISFLPSAEVWLLACPDDKLHDVCTDLATSGAIVAGAIVFHCSGALTAQDALQAARDCGAYIASVHPIKSFASPAHAINDFSGTFCGVEGDAEALTVLMPAFSALGAQCFEIKPEAKTLYHAASVIGCNYLVALQELSIQTFAQAGVERELAMKILQPMVQGTINNIFRMGTRAALTGPIARGDMTVVEKQINALNGWNADYADLYQQLGRIALQLSQTNAPQLP